MVCCLRGVEDHRFKGVETKSRNCLPQLELWRGNAVQSYSLVLSFVAAPISPQSHHLLLACLSPVVALGMAMLGCGPALLPIVAALLAIAADLLFVVPSDRSPPPSRDISPLSISRLAEFFSKDYFEARMRFLAAARARGASIRSYPIDEANAIFVDVAVLPGDSDSTLIHASGTHGVEGYAGSAVQLAALTEANTVVDLQHRPTLVFVHALNAYGFARNRRNNEDNVDLNRNFLTAADFKHLAAKDPNFAGYEDASFLYNPGRSLLTPSTLLNEVLAAFLTLRAVVTLGMHRLKVALVSGNYVYPAGLGYAGNSSTRSNLILREVISEYTSSSSHLVLVDVHTGLGPSGVDSLGINLHRGRALAANDFPTEVTDGRVTGGVHDSISRPGEDSAFAGYALTRGTISGELCGQVAQESPHLATVLCLTQEIGTVSNVVVGAAQVLENNAFFFGSEEQRERYAGRLRDVFCLKGRNWRFNVVRRGLAVIGDAAKYLSSAAAAAE